MRPGKYLDSDPELEILNSVKVWSMILIVLGNTHYYLMSGPVQNMQIIDQWPKNFIFMFVLQSDLQSDVFFWITAFTWSFTILKNINQLSNQTPIWKLVLGRYLRLAPMYYFMILFMWKFLMLFGGHGPRYFMYEEDHSCHESWFWHFTFLNNILPWKQSSNCLQQTWYLANDL